MSEAKIPATRERVWTFLNIYYGKKKTTPSLKVIEDKLKLKRASVKSAIIGLEKEGYIRVTMHGTSKFIILIRIGRYI